MFEIIRVFISNHPIVFSAVSGAIGFVSGAAFNHKLTLTREKRKEFNECAEGIGTKLRTSLRIIEQGGVPNNLGSVSSMDFDALLERTGRIKQHGLRDAWTAYKTAQEQCGGFDDDGFYKFHSPQILVLAIKKMLRYTKRM